MVELLMYPPFLGITSGAVIAVVAIVASHWRAVREVELETGLKRDMVDRGMSADEITQVLEATDGGRRARPRR